MHELSIARRIVLIALSEAEKHEAKRVLQVRVRIGEFSFLRPEQLSFWFKTLSQGTLLEGAELVIDIEPGEVRCPSCGYAGPIEVREDPLYHVVFPTLSCPRCGRPVQITRGKGYSITSIRLLKQRANS